jgi:hypothetical protein
LDDAPPALESIPVEFDAETDRRFSFGDIIEQINDFVFSFAYEVKDVVHRLTNIRMPSPFLNKHQATLHGKSVVIITELLA